jgi:hypothetical protein
MYENRTMKPVEIVLTREGEEMRWGDGMGELFKIYYNYICK